MPGGKRWTKRQDARLLKLRAEGKNDAAIADILLRTPAGISSRLRYLGAYTALNAGRILSEGNFGTAPRYLVSYLGNDPTLAPEIEEERDHRLSLLPQTVTASICGDPLPGYSALDQRNNQFALASSHLGAKKPAEMRHSPSPPRPCVSAGDNSDGDDA